MSNFFIGIDTSNYTTSLAVCRDGEIIANLKKPVFVKDGDRGIRQSNALFNHVKNLPELFDSLDGLGVVPTAIGVSNKPRDVEGSYMPCFLAGVTVAKASAALLRVPLYSFSHQRGHLRAAIYSSKMPVYSEYIAFHVSGGTTEMLHVSDDEISLVGATLDINAGQLIDRVGVKMGLAFPCGMSMEKLCDFDSKCKVKPKICVNGLNCNLSGLENIATSMLNSGYDKMDVAYFVLESVRATLDKMTENALAKFGDLPILFSGGVMSNSYIKKCFENKYGAYFAKPEFSADNASGIALLSMDKYIRDNRTIV